MSKELKGLFRINIEIPKDEPSKTEIICKGDNEVVTQCAINAIVETFSAMDKTNEDITASYALICELAKNLIMRVKKK